MRAMHIPQFHGGGAGIGVAARFGHADLVAAASVTNQSGLQGWSWHVASGGWAAAVVEGGGGDFMSAADTDPTRASGSVGGNNFAEMNAMIGDYASFLIAQRLLGETPRQLVLDMYARMQGGGGIGLGNSLADVAVVQQSGANWALVTPTGNTAFGTYDNAWHNWMFVLDSAGVTLLLDGTTVATRALPLDRFPTWIFTKIGAANPTPEVAWYDCRWEA